MLERNRLDEWSLNGFAYGRNEDLYSGAESAADIIETVIGSRSARRR